MQYSIIRKSQLEGALRLDAEYYQPEYLELDEALCKTGSLGLDQIAEIITDGDHGNPEYADIGLPYVKSENINELAIEVDSAMKVSFDYSEKVRGACFSEKDDILLTTVGRIGTSTINHFTNKEIILSRDIARIKLKKDCNFYPEFISVFFNSIKGRLLTKRESVGTVQQGLYLATIKKLSIPKVSLDKQRNIKELFLQAREESENSKSIYSQAEDLLLGQLGLKDFKVENDLSYVVNLSEIKSAHRADAEYFQPKYEKLILKIKKQNAKKLESFVKNYSTGFPFKSENYQEEGIPLIRINNIKKGYIDLGDTVYLSEKDYLLSPKDTARSGDIVLSMSGTIGTTAILPNDISKSSANQRILKFTPQNIDRDYLVLLLNSVVGSYQLERIGTGGVQTNISYKDIKNILIPESPKPNQQEIGDLVRQSNESRKKEKELIDKAQQKVEELIEK